MPSYACACTVSRNKRYMSKFTVPHFSTVRAIYFVECGKIAIFLFCGLQWSKCCSVNYLGLRAVLRGHKKVVFRLQKRTTLFDVKSSTYFTFYVGHSTRQGISLLRVSNRITHDIQPHTSQLHSVQQLPLIFTIVRYFEYCFQKPIAAPRWTPAGAAPLFHTPRSSDT